MDGEIEEICLNRVQGICKEKKCPRNYLFNGHGYHCPEGLKYEKEEIPKLTKNVGNIKLLEKLMRIGELT
jgi:hypothetical protein